ncbi:hypothetical protein [Thermanaerovibrio acidaminovorans]|jgi:hypothetical protein|uniref:hypothetical protein n=1 Tax=Thermanaerovibrio acidaminovorans TaxID=81462 RepID=UPI0001A3D091|nr:hypothetical protein [Thermanaerovibrio acidaminovorans]
MMYLWRTNKLGKIWVDGEAMRRTVSTLLPGGYVCQEASFSGHSDTLNLFLSVPQGEPKDKLNRVGRLIESRLAGSAIKVSIHWTEREPGGGPQQVPLWRNPLVWASGTAALVALAQLGFRGIAKSILAAGLAYGISWLVVTDDGRKLVNTIIKEVKDRR